MTQAEKRARANTAGESHTTQASPSTETAREELLKNIELLSQEQLVSIIVWAADKHDDITRAVAVLARKIREEKEIEAQKRLVEEQKRLIQEKNKVIGFDDSASKVWDLITKDRRISESRERNQAYGVAMKIADIAKKVAQACGKSASPGTRLNGLSALTEICKTATTTSLNMTSRMARQHLGDKWGSKYLIDPMLSIICAMSPEEIHAIRQDESPEGLWHYMLELQDATRAYCVLESLSEVMSLFDVGSQGNEHGVEDISTEGAPAEGDLIAAQANTQVIDFDYYSKSVWRSINHTRGMSGPREYEASFDVASSVESVASLIASQCGESANPKTRYNGLSVLRKIGKTICLSNGTLAHYVQQEIGSSKAFTDSMMSIANAMSTEERCDIRKDTSPEGLWQKLVELESLAKNYCVFEDLPEVLDLFYDGYQEDEGEDGNGNGPAEDDPAEDGPNVGGDGDNLFEAHDATGANVQNPILL